MADRLNVGVLRSSLKSAGLNQAQLAKRLDVSREAVSKWFREESLPRPDKLLRLALVLETSIDELVVAGDVPPEPRIFFRKRGAGKTTEKHIKKATEIGWALRTMVSLLPFDKLVKPSTLKQPIVDYDYVQTVAGRVRNEIGLGALDELRFESLIHHFNALQAVLIPVMWGQKDNHENALHIYLPDSFTTWIHLNLDSEIHDFKFWMAHELGHVLTPHLDRETAENFADSFAGALLFPKEAAKQTYLNLHALKNQGQRINRIKDLACEFVISPITIYLEANRYAKSAGLEPLGLEPAIYGAAKNLHKGFGSVSEYLFDGKVPTAADYMRISSDVFETPFFDALKARSSESGFTTSFVQTVLQVPVTDAKAIYQELCGGEAADIT